MTVAAKRNIFMHARAYLQGQSHVKDIHQRKRLVQSVVEGTRLHQKQGDTVTTLQENVAEQQEVRRKAEEEELEAQRLEMEVAAKEEVIEAEYHTANSTLTSVGFLHSQVAKLEALAKSYEDNSLIATAVLSAQNCASLLMTLKSKVSDDEDLLKYIREAGFSADELSVSLLHDLQGELAKMREALQSAKETARVESEQQKDVLQLVGSIYEDMLKLQVSASMDSELESTETEVPTEAVHQDAEPADAEDAMPSAAEASETLEALEAVVTTADGPAEEEEAPEEEASECGGDAGTRTVSTALPALGAFAMQDGSQPGDPQLEDPQPENPQLENLHPEAERSELPQLAGSHTDAGERPSQAGEGVQVADAPIPLPKIGSKEVVDSALGTPQAAELQTARDATTLPCAVAPPAVPEGAVPEGAAAVRKARKKRLIIAPKVRLPPLAALNRKKTGDLDWNMEHLNEAELKLLTSVLAEDGVRHSQSVVVSPKKERLWKEVWGLEDASSRFTNTSSRPFPPCPEVLEEEAPEVAVEWLEVQKPRFRKVRTLTDLSRCGSWDLQGAKKAKASVRQRMAQIE